MQQVFRADINAALERMVAGGWPEHAGEDPALEGGDKTVVWLRKPERVATPYADQWRLMKLALRSLGFAIWAMFRLAVRDSFGRLLGVGFSWRERRLQVCVGLTAMSWGCTVATLVFTALR